MNNLFLIIILLILIIIGANKYTITKLYNDYNDKHIMNGGNELSINKYIINHENDIDNNSVVNTNSHDIVVNKLQEDFTKIKLDESNTINNYIDTHKNIIQKKGLKKNKVTFKPTTKVRLFNKETREIIGADETMKI